MKTVGKPFYCPRRDDTMRSFAGGPTFYPDPEQQIGTTPLEDHWRDEGLRHAHITGGLPTCSYCGSLRPEDFIQAIRDGREIHGTDKRYKAYVMLPNPNAGKPRWISATNAAERPAGKGWVSAAEIDRAELERDGWTYEWGWYLQSADSAASQAKFYFQHIAHPSPLRAEFFDWWTTSGYSLFYSGAPIGIRQEYIARHPDQMTDADRTALETLRQRAPEIAAP